MSIRKGRVADLERALYTWIDACWNRYYSTYKVEANLDIDYKNLNLPHANIRVTLDQITDELFGRIISSSVKGSPARYTFSIHVHAKKGDRPYEMRTVQIAAQYIEDMLEKKNSERSDLDTYAIYAISDIGSRPSTPRSRALARMIIEGAIEVRRDDYTTTTSTTSTSTSTTSTSTSTTSTTSTTSPP